MRRSIHSLQLMPGASQYNLNLDDDNFDDEDPETIIHVRLMAWHYRQTMQGM